MPKKNIIIRILQTATAIRLTKFSSFIAFYLDWRVLLMRYRRASNKKAICKILAKNISPQILNGEHQILDNQLYKVNNQIQLQQHQIKICYLFQSSGSYFYLMIDRICLNYKKILDLLKKKN
jgi:ABC-type molybdate transport system ATPase subunit